MRTKSETRQALDLAIKRIRHGVPKVVSPAQQISIAAVAKEAGISNAAIHNHHPDIADAIRQMNNKTEATRLEVSRNKLKDCETRLAKLRAEHAQLEIDLQRSQSINLCLLKENELLRITSAEEANVFAIRR